MQTRSGKITARKDFRNPKKQQKDNEVVQQNEILEEKQNEDN